MAFATLRLSNDSRSLVLRVQRFLQGTAWIEAGFWQVNCCEKSNNFVTSLKVSLVFGSTKMLPAQLSDEILAARVAQGDSTALEILYDRHAPTIQGISLKIIGDRAAAEEVLQETFWRVWQSAVTYQSERGSFTGWLFRIARNLAIDAYRRRSVRPQTITETADANPILNQILDPSMHVPEQVQSKLKTQQVRNALRVLSLEQRHVIEMAYFYGMTRQEIAKVTGEALGTVHTRARLGLKKLREELQSIVEFEG